MMIIPTGYTWRSLNFSRLLRVLSTPSVSILLKETKLGVACKATIQLHCMTVCLFVYFYFFHVLDTLNWTKICNVHPLGKLREFSSLSYGNPPSLKIKPRKCGLIHASDREQKRKERERSFKILLRTKLT